MTTNNNNISAPDLTKRPPRSPRIRLGGYVLLPRMLDKGRAEIAGQSGEYHYNCPLDQHFVNFVGIDPAALREELAAGKGDGEILAWINETAQHKRTPWEIEQWSEYMQRRGPDSDAESLQYFARHARTRSSQTREDIKTWADVLDLDDYVTFGGEAVSAPRVGSNEELAPAVGFEPTTNRLTADRSTTELRWNLGVYRLLTAIRGASASFEDAGEGYSRWPIFFTDVEIFMQAGALPPVMPGLLARSLSGFGLTTGDYITLSIGTRSHRPARRNPARRAALRAGSEDSRRGARKLRAAAARDADHVCLRDARSGGGAHRFQTVLR